MHGESTDDRSMLIAEDLMLLLTGDDVLDEALTMVTSKEGKKPRPS